MGKLVYAISTSLDGYIEDASGNFDWAEPEEDAHRAFNALTEPVGLHLYGRRMYEVMQAWETLDREPDQPDVILEFARVWQSADKVVYSSTLASVSSERTTIERTFEPDRVREWKRDIDADLMIGGPGLAAEAFRAGLIDEVHLFVNPVSVGGGKHAMPADLRVDLELVRERRYGNGTVELHYTVKAG